MADIAAVLNAGPGAPGDSVDAFLATAARESLVDVAVAPVDAPFGRVWVAVTPRGLVRVSYDDHETVLSELARRVSPRVLDAPAQADAVRRQLDEYFAGTRTSFDLPLDTSLVRSEFQRRVLDAAAAIPYGGHRTYGEVALTAGSPKAVRAVGSALGANPLCVVVPCHRVLRAGGGLGGYAGGVAVKQWLLDAEGSDSRTLRR
jgi:methylated-DNA-[protein]-cysteine S-methyltransferase